MRLMSILLYCIFSTQGCWGHENELRIAVVSNFLVPLKEIAHRFELKTGAHVLVSSGSTGKLFAHIQHGAPYDIFLSADDLRPKILEQHKQIIKGSRVTYAIGRLVVWAPGQVIKNGALTLLPHQYIALANEKTAPYGMAAKQALTSLKLWNTFSSQAVIGENVAQTLAFVTTGNACMGVVALSQVLLLDKNIHDESVWVVPQHLYQKINQQAVILKGAQNKALAEEFLLFLYDPKIRDFIVESGYSTPHE